MLIFKVFTLISAVHCSASPKRINLIWFHCWLISSRAHKWSLSFKQPVALLTGDEEENEPKFSLRAVEVQAVPVGFLGFGVGWLYNLQSYTHTAVRCRRAGGRRLGSNRKTGSSLWRQTNPVSLQFLQSHHFRAGYNLTARTQIKAVENNLGGTF